jgi:acyl-CoA synthetase (NDP forming)
LESKQLCEAYDIPTPREGLATSATAAVRLAQDIGYPVVLKIASADILHKTEAGGVLTGLGSAAEVKRGYATLMQNAHAYNAKAQIAGVQVQQMLPAAQEVIVGATTDPSFGKLVAFGLGGVLVEVMQDITFRLAPTTRPGALSMLDEIAGAAVLRGVRGASGIQREALAALIENVSRLVHDFPEISEMDLNPVFANSTGATAVDVRILVDFAPPKQHYRPSQEEILQACDVLCSQMLWR